MEQTKIASFQFVWFVLEFANLTNQQFFIIQEITLYFCAIVPFRSGGASVLCRRQKRRTMSAIETKMQDLLDMLNEGRAHVKVEMNAEDLKAFSEDLIRRAKDELGSMVEAAKKERMVTKAEVKKLFGVCDATLWHWANKGILKPVKTGNKIMYPEYEVRKAPGQRNINIWAPWKRMAITTIHAFRWKPDADWLRRIALSLTATRVNLPKLLRSL